jgi:23S rRNA pseudouridine1911/1915/1917 synthase
MVFARTSKAASRLSEQIRNHQMDKIYLCVVQGCPERLRGHLTDYLLKDRDNNIVSVVEQGTFGAKHAVLDYEVLKSSGGLSLIKVNLLTGRSHQIRAQMSNNKTP